jgi:integrase
MLLVSNTSLGQGFIDVIGSKHHRDRRIFLSDESTEYFVRYDNEVSSTFPDRTFFFPTSTDTGCDANFVNKNFNHIWDAAELRKKTGKQPQPYAFRHHFAFANINRWTDEGKNVNEMLPYLMRYMGHASLASTCYYIHLVPDFFAAYEQIAGALDDLIPEVGNG